MQRVPDIDEGGDAYKTRQQFADHVELLRRQLFGEVRESRDVAAGSGQALYQAEADRVRAGRHHDRDRSGGFAHREAGRQRPRHDDFRIEPDHHLRQGREAIEEAVSVTVFDADVAPLEVTKLTQCGAKCLVARRCGLGRRGIQDTDQRGLRLLGPRGERDKRRRTTQQRDEIPPLHSNTSLGWHPTLWASASRSSGNGKPRE